MNAPNRLLLIAGSAARLAGPLLVLGLAGCASSSKVFNLGPVDPRSPIAGDVAALAHQNKAFPTFASIPPLPADQRPVKSWGQTADKVAAAGKQLERETAANTWTLTGTETFAASALRQAGPAISGPESTTADTEAYARDMRKRATPPPPPKR